MPWDLGRFWNTLTYYEALPWAEVWRRVQNGFQAVEDDFVPPSLSEPVAIQIGVVGEGLPDGLAEALRQQGVEVSHTPDWATATVILGLGDPPTAKAYLEQLRSSGQTERMLFDFRRPNPDLHRFWGILDDVVMGGASQSQLLWGKEELLFAGQFPRPTLGGLFPRAPAIGSRRWTCRGLPVWSCACEGMGSGIRSYCGIKAAGTAPPTAMRSTLRREKSRPFRSPLRRWLPRSAPALCLRLLRSILARSALCR